MKRIVAIVAALVAAMAMLAAQEVSNARVEQEGQKVRVWYDLVGGSAEVSLHLSVDGGRTFTQVNPAHLNGAVGQGVKPGQGLTIVWDVLADRERLQGDNIMFAVRIAGDQQRTFTVGGVSFKMVYVAGGSFTMGCTAEQRRDCDSDEKPSHTVTLDGYWIGETEVTQALWEAVMGNNPSRFKGNNRPVETVSYNDAVDFCNELSRLTMHQFRLPTEAEWEYAARGGQKSKGYKYSGGSDLDQVGWYDGNSGSSTHVVKQKRPNELGLYDMSGNVWEWCSDGYGKYGSGSQTNPKGSSSGARRVLRGGSWISDAEYCRVANRNGNNPAYRDYDSGLRVVLSQ